MAVMNRENTIDMDPDYEDISAHQAKRMKLMENDAKEATIRKIEMIVNQHCNEGCQELSQMLDHVDQEYYVLRDEIDKLRARVVAYYYKTAEQETSTKTSGQFNQQTHSPSIHPAVKKLLGKIPKVQSSSSFNQSSYVPVKMENVTPEVKQEPVQLKETEKNSISKTPVIMDKSLLQPKALKLSPQNDNKRGSRFKIKKRILVGHMSRFLPSETREENDHSTHKWMIYVRGSKEEPNIESFVKKVRFFLHPSYRPNDLVDVCHYPFHLIRRGWGEFPVRVQIHFNDRRNKPVDIVHFLTLDKTYTGLQTAGGETQAEVELEKFCSEESRTCISLPSDIETDNLPVEKHQTISHNVKEISNDIVTSSSSDAPCPNSVEIKKESTLVCSPVVSLTCENKDIKVEKKNDSKTTSITVPLLTSYPVIKTESETCNNILSTTVNYSQMPRLHTSSCEKLKEEPTSVPPINTTSASLPVSSSTKLSSCTTSTVTVSNSLIKPITAATVSNGTILLNSPTVWVKSVNKDKSQGMAAGLNTSRKLILKNSCSPASTVKNTSLKGVTTFIKCTDKIGNVFLIPESSLFREPPTSLMNSSSSVSVKSIVTTSTTSSSHTQLATVTSSVSSHPSPSISHTDIPITKSDVDSKKSCVGQSSGHTFILKLVSNSASMKSTTNQIVFLPTAVTSNLGCAAADEVTTAQVSDKKSAVAEKINTTVIARNQALSSLSNKIIIPDVKIRLEDLSCMEQLVKTFAKKHLLVKSDSDINIFPYTSPSFSTFMSWNIGKRRAVEWQRASSIRQCILKALNGSDSFKNESVWTTKQIMLWCRRHGFTPLDIVETDIIDSQAFSKSSECKFFSFSKSQELMDRLKDVKSNYLPESEKDIDIININLPTKIKIKEEPENSYYSQWFCLPPTSPCIEYIQDSVEQIGLRFDAVEVTSQVFAPVIEEMLLACTREFARDILGKALNQASQHCYINGRLPSMISSQDVYKGLQTLPYFDFLTNKYLGIPVKKSEESKPT